MDADNLERLMGIIDLLDHFKERMAQVTRRRGSVSTIYKSVHSDELDSLPTTDRSSVTKRIFAANSQELVGFGSRELERLPTTGAISRLATLTTMMSRGRSVAFMTATSKGFNKRRQSLGGINKFVENDNNGMSFSRRKSVRFGDNESETSDKDTGDIQHFMSRALNRAFSGRTGNGFGRSTSRLDRQTTMNRDTINEDTFISQLSSITHEEFANEDERITGAREVFLIHKLSTGLSDPGELSSESSDASSDISDEIRQNTVLLSRPHIALPEKSRLRGSVAFRDDNDDKKKKISFSQPQQSDRLREPLKSQKDYPSEPNVYHLDSEENDNYLINQTVSDTESDMDNNDVSLLYQQQIINDFGEDAVLHMAATSPDILEQLFEKITIYIKQDLGELLDSIQTKVQTSELKLEQIEGHFKNAVSKAEIQEIEIHDLNKQIEKLQHFKGTYYDTAKSLKKNMYDLETVTNKLNTVEAQVEIQKFQTLQLKTSHAQEVNQIKETLKEKEHLLESAIQKEHELLKAKTIHFAETTDHQERHGISDQTDPLLMSQKSRRLHIINPLPQGQEASYMFNVTQTSSPLPCMESTFRPREDDFMQHLGERVGELESQLHIALGQAAGMDSLHSTIDALRCQLDLEIEKNQKLLTQSSEKEESIANDTRNNFVISEKNAMIIIGLKTDLETLRNVLKKTENENVELLTMKELLIDQLHQLQNDYDLKQHCLIKEHHQLLEQSREEYQTIIHAISEENETFKKDIHILKTQLELATHQVNSLDIQQLHTTIKENDNKINELTLMTESLIVENKQLQDISNILQNTNMVLEIQLQELRDNLNNTQSITSTQEQVQQLNEPSLQKTLGDIEADTHRLEQEIHDIKHHFKITYDSLELNFTQQKKELEETKMYVYVVQQTHNQMIYGLRRTYNDLIQENGLIQHHWDSIVEHNSFVLLHPTNQSMLQIDDRIKITDMSYLNETFSKQVSEGLELLAKCEEDTQEHMSEDITPSSSNKGDRLSTIRQLTAARDVITDQSISLIPCHVSIEKILLTLDESYKIVAAKNKMMIALLTQDIHNQHDDVLGLRDKIQDLERRLESAPLPVSFPEPCTTDASLLNEFNSLKNDNLFLMNSLQQVREEVTLGKEIIEKQQLELHQQQGMYTTLNGVYESESDRHNASIEQFNSLVKQLEAKIKENEQDHVIITSRCLELEEKVKQLQDINKQQPDDRIKYELTLVKDQLNQVQLENDVLLNSTINKLKEDIINKNETCFKHLKKIKSLEHVINDLQQKIKDDEITKQYTIKNDQTADNSLTEITELKNKVIRRELEYKEKEEVWKKQYQNIEQQNQFLNKRIYNLNLLLTQLNQQLRQLQYTLSTNQKCCSILSSCCPIKTESYQALTDLEIPNTASSQNTNHQSILSTNTTMMSQYILRQSNPCYTTYCQNRMQRLETPSVTALRFQQRRSLPH